MYVCKYDVCPYQGDAMAVCAANPEQGVTGLKPVSVPVPAASSAPASSLGRPSWARDDIPRHRHFLQTTALCAHGDGGDGGWIGREPSRHLTPLAEGMEDAAAILCDSSSHFVTEVFPVLDN